MVPQIIVCDDEPHIIRAIALKFTRADFDVQGAADVETCWRMLHRSNPPAFLIIDDALPTEPSGLELVRRVRADANLMNLPIILLTTRNCDLQDYKEQLSAYQIAEIVAKPFSPRELLSTVNRLLEHDTNVQAPTFVTRRNSSSVK